MIPNSNVIITVIINPMISDRKKSEPKEQIHIRLNQ